MTGGIGGIPDRTAKLEMAEAAAKAKEISTEAKAAKASAQASNAETATRARTPKLKKSLKAQKTRIQKLKLKAEKGKSILPIEQIRRTAEEFQKRNPELKEKILTLLRQMIKPTDTKDEILKKVLETFNDVSLADEALEFLLETTEGALHQEVQKAKDEFLEMHGREIKAGRNIHTEARQAAEVGLGTPTTMRDLYRDVTGNPRDTNTLFKELTDQYSFSQMKKVVDFLLHSMGSDMKSKGPSIPKGELYRLMTEVRSLQAMLGVFGFFQRRMKLVEAMFRSRG